MNDRPPLYRTPIRRHDRPLFSDIHSDVFPDIFSSYFLWPEKSSDLTIERAPKYEKNDLANVSDIPSLNFSVCQRIPPLFNKFSYQFRSSDLIQ